jgi:hypothetical protein
MQPKGFIGARKARLRPVPPSPVFDLLVRGDFSINYILSAMLPQSASVHIGFKVQGLGLGCRV